MAPDVDQGDAPPEEETAAPHGKRNGGSEVCKQRFPTLAELRLGVFGGGAWPPEPIDALTASLIAILHNLLGPRERHLLGVSALAAMEPEDRLAAAENTLGIPPWEEAQE